MDIVTPLEDLSASIEFSDLSRYVKSFDLFKMMGISTKELVHSNIIAALMNEREPHGLGSALRDQYVASLADCKCVGTPIPQHLLASTSGVHAKIARELEHIDIVLDFPSLRLVIAIENKIWAQDQHQQLARYQQALCDLFPHYAHRAVVYLTPKGRESPTVDHHSPTPVYYQSYGQLAHLLRQQKSSVASAHQFLDQLISHIEKTMSGNSDLKQLCWRIFEQNEEAYEHLYAHYEYCQRRKLDQRFEYLDSQVLTGNLFAEWSGRVETRLTRHPDKRRYDLDVRVTSWPAGLWVKIYKHTWLGVFPYFLASDSTSLAQCLPMFTSPLREVPDWSGHYFASKGYWIKHDRCIFDLGDKATEIHFNQALSKLRDCLEEIDQACHSKSA